jgi:hypothetical protein
MRVPGRELEASRLRERVLQNTRDVVDRDVLEDILRTGVRQRAIAVHVRRPRHVHAPIPPVRRVDVEHLPADIPELPRRLERHTDAVVAEHVAEVRRRATGELCTEQAARSHA